MITALYTISLIAAYLALALTIAKVCGFNRYSDDE